MYYHLLHLLWCVQLLMIILAQMVKLPTRQGNILNSPFDNDVDVDVVAHVHPVASLPGTDHKAIHFEISVVPQRSKIILVICTIIMRLNFVVHCVICLGTVFLVLMLRKHGHCGRICFW